MGPKVVKAKYNTTALKRAIKDDDVELITTLLKKGYPINEPIDGVNPLLFCAAHGYEDGLEALLRAGVDKNVTDKAGLTVIHHACRSQNLRTLRYMI